MKFIYFVSFTFIRDDNESLSVGNSIIYLDNPITTEKDIHDVTRFIWFNLNEVKKQSIVITNYIFMRTDETK